MLQATQLQFGRPGGFRLATRAIDFVPGRITGVLGPNGSGKSTFLQLLSGILKPKTGAITWGGRSRRELGAKGWAQRVAAIPQEAGAIPEMDVRQYVSLGLIPKEGVFGAPSPEGVETVAKVMDVCNIVHLAERRLAELSGGQRQRVRIAKALAQTPPTLILDEPANHLDLHAIGHLADLLHRLADDGLAVVVSMHDIDLASHLSDEVMVLHEGRTEIIGPTSEVLTPELIKHCWGVDVITLDDGDSRRYLLKY